MEIMKTADGVPFVRTLESAFVGLPDYSYDPKYLSFEGLRLHYIDVGPRDGPTALLMHGMPTWSYLNRHIIDALVEAGWRCLAADHIGFGKSDKVIDEAWYSIARHTRAHRALIEALDLAGLTLFCQDWGGPIGLAQAAAMPARFSRLVIMNTWLHHTDFIYTPAIRNWNQLWHREGMLARAIPDKLSIGEFMALALGFCAPTDLMERVTTGTPMPLNATQAAICRGYSAPFEGLGHDGHAGARRFPLSLPFANPQGGDAEAQAQNFKTLKSWTKPVHFIWGGGDDVFPEAWARTWAAMYPQATLDLIPGGRHFLQETQGREVARIFLSKLGS